ncbi:MAG: hypothetical protein R3F59_32455 [Myxococcota bacterium]
MTDGAWLLPSHRALEAPGGERDGLDPDVTVVLSPAERLQVRCDAGRELPPVHPDGTPVPDLRDGGALGAAAAVGGSAAGRALRLAQSRCARTLWSEVGSRG